MKKQTIAVDLDDVVSSQAETLMEFLNATYDANITWDDFKKPGEYWSYFEELGHVDKTEGARRFEEFLDNDHLYLQKVDPAAVAAMGKLKELGYQLEIVTSRGLSYQKGTEAWLEKHLPGVFANLHFVELWGTGDNKLTKGLICKEIGAGYLIDDNADHCNLAIEVGVTALLFGEYGWNLHQKINPGVVRVNDWQAVLEYFDEQG